MQDILIIGTGKMARNIGLFFVRNNCRITWVSRNKDRAELFAARIQKDIRRLALILDKPIDDFNTHVSIISDIPQNTYDLILESIEEELSEKQKVINLITALLKSDTVLASNSSSILPHQIHKKVIGLHFFYPVELTGLVEIIQNSKTDSKKVQELINKLNLWDIKSILQNEQNAFAVNRLLLPMQAEAFRLLQKGYPAGIINECSKSDQIKIGQLELMDSIGFDVLLPAMKNYVFRMPIEKQENYNPLINGLNTLIQKGKLGGKNKNGILIGKPLPWKSNDRFSNEANHLEKKFIDIFTNTCRQFIDSKQIQDDELKHVLKVLLS